MSSYSQQNLVYQLPSLSCAEPAAGAKANDDALAISIPPDLAGFLAQVSAGAKGAAASPPPADPMCDLLQQLEADFASLVSDLTDATPAAGVDRLTRQLEEEFAALIAEINRGAPAAPSTEASAPTSDSLDAAAKAIFSDLRAALSSFDAAPLGDEDGDSHDGHSLGGRSTAAPATEAAPLRAAG
jgi:hypothetical protein